MSQQAPAILTKEFCQNNRLYFHPRSEEEAAFIQERFFAMGLSWPHGKEIMKLKELAEGTLYFNSKVTPGHFGWDLGRMCPADSIFCTAAQLGWQQMMPERRRQQEHITSEFCKNKTLLFYPGHTEDAGYIQQKLFDMGFVWSGENPWAHIIHTAQCCELGMVAVSGKIYLDPSDDDIRKGVIVHTEQLGDDCPKRYPTPEQLERQAMFNQLSARLLKQDAKIADLHDEIMPKPLEKRAFPGIRPR